VKSNRE